MAQDFYFYKQKIIPEERAQLFSQKEVENSIKTLLEKRNLEEDIKLREKLFEEVESSITISAYTEGIKELLDKEIDFIPAGSRRFMMNQKIWSIVQEKISEQLEQYNKAIENSKETTMQTDTKVEESRNEVLKQQYLRLLKDSQVLEELFNKNLLFVNLY